MQPTRFRPTYKNNSFPIEFRATDGILPYRFYRLPPHWPYSLFQGLCSLPATPSGMPDFRMFMFLIDFRFYFPVGFGVWEGGGNRVGNPEPWDICMCIGVCYQYRTHESIQHASTDYWALHPTSGLWTRLLGFVPDYWALHPTTLL